MQEVDFSKSSIHQYWQAQSEDFYQSLISLELLEPWTVKEDLTEIASFFHFVQGLKKNDFTNYAASIIKVLHYMPLSVFLRFIAWLNFESEHNGVFLYLLMECRREKAHNLYYFSFFQRIEYFHQMKSTHFLSNAYIEKLIGKVFDKQPNQ
jgi:hypothetical protein